jgi:hypothetical protein
MINTAAKSHIKLRNKQDIAVLFASTKFKRCGNLLKMAAGR